MKNVTKSRIVLALSLLVLVFVLTSRCNKMDAASIKYVSTPGEVETIILPNQDSSSTKLSMEIFPKEIFFGDTVYLVIYCENVSGEVVTIIDRGFSQYSAKEFTLSSTVTNQEYIWKPEHLTANSSYCQAAIYKGLQPGERHFDKKYDLAFPPLEDLKHPFWKELSTNMPKEGTLCKLHITYTSPEVITGLRREYHTMEVTQDILIKPRPKNEMALLNKWYRNTPKKLFPKEKDDYKEPQNDYNVLRSSGKSDIWIGWRKYDPWLFIRYGNRKPSDPNNPTTLDGWRKLEARLAPSTMRDEVRLTRLQLEYYSAKPGEASENAKNELVEWLKSLPEVQRAAMTTYLAGQMGRYDYAHYRRRRLGEKQERIRVGKSQELILAIYEILDSRSQDRVSSSEGSIFGDCILPLPARVKAVMEAFGPTAEDLAYGTKELPDGFRIWDYDMNHRRIQIVGKFVEANIPDDGQRGGTLVITRNGEDYPISNTSLSEEDWQYVREQSRKITSEE